MDRRRAEGRRRACDGGAVRGGPLLAGGRAWRRRAQARSGKDRRTILANSHETRKAAKHPELVFEADGLSVAAGGTSVTVTGEVVQPALGITPYTGMLGALKVRDAIEVRASLTPGQSVTRVGGCR